MVTKVVVNVKVDWWVTPLLKFAASALRFIIDFIVKFGLMIKTTDASKGNASYVVDTAWGEIEISARQEAPDD